MKQYFVYVLASKKNGTLYIGFAKDLRKRVIEHRTKAVQGFTSRYGVGILVHYEEYGNSYDAFRRERQLKKWNRAWKIELIEKDNPNWDDLAADWTD